MPGVQRGSHCNHIDTRTEHPTRLLRCKLPYTYTAKARANSDSATPTASTSICDKRFCKLECTSRDPRGGGRGLPAADLCAACVLEAGAVAVAAAVRAHAAAGAGVRRDPAGFSNPGRVSQQPHGTSSTARGNDRPATKAAMDFTVWLHGPG